MPKVGPLRVHLYFTSLRDVSPRGFLDMEGDTFQIDDQATLIEAEKAEKQLRRLKDKLGPVLRIFLGPSLVPSRRHCANALCHLSLEPCRTSEKKL